MTTATAQDAEPAADVKTIADLPFHVMGRFQKPLAMGRCRGGQIDGLSSKELFESVRDAPVSRTACEIHACFDKLGIALKSSERRAT